MAAPFRPAGFEVDSDEFDGDGFFLGDDDDIGNDKNGEVLFTSGVHSEPLSTTGFWNHDMPRAQTTSRERTVKLVPSRDAFVAGSETMTVDDFRMAVMRGNAELVTQYLDHGFEVDTVLRSGWTGLMYAASCCDHQIMSLLVGRGANVNAHKDHYTCLMAVCSSTKSGGENLIKCVSLLLENGCDVNTFDRYHMTSLMYASRDGKANLVLQLVEAGAEINKQDHRGWTALVWAASRGQANVTSTLVRHGADVTVKCRNGQTAGDVAASQGYQKICELLTRLGKEKKPDEQILSELSAVPSVPTNFIVAPPTRQFESYGEMELFLAGLDFGHLIDVFRNQGVDFSMFLRMSDDDLMKAGVSKLGERRKILDAIHAVHKKDWKETSLQPSPYTKQLSSGEVLSTIGNISRHLDYVGATVAYVRQQVDERPEMMRQATDANSLLKLKSLADDSVTHTCKLHRELCQLQHIVHQMIGSGDYLPVDLVAPDGNSDARSFRIKTSLFVATCLGLALVWKKDSILTVSSRIINKIHDKFISQLPIHAASSGAEYICEHIPGLVNKQRKICRRYPDVMDSIREGAKAGIAECQVQFSFNRWNCTTFDRDSTVFGKVMLRGSREAAFVYAISSAGVMNSITRACSKGTIRSCSCDPTKTGAGRDKKGLFQWGGCSHHVRYGSQFARMFVDAREKKGRDARALMNLHNNRAGRRAVRKHMELRCKCHGVSGSCAVRTCWLAMQDFMHVGNYLRRKYDGATLVMMNQEATNIIVANRAHKKPTRSDLVYLEKSPDYCIKASEHGSLGTAGRECNATSLGTDGCDIMCCGRGYNTRTTRQVRQCRCKFKWCCQVECETCEEWVSIHTCKSLDEAPEARLSRLLRRRNRG